MPEKLKKFAKDIVVQIYPKPKPRPGGITGGQGVYVSSVQITRTPKADSEPAPARTKPKAKKAATAKKPAAKKSPAKAAKKTGAKKPAKNKKK